MRVLLLTISIAGISVGALQAADAAAGKAAYDKSCKACHGADGTPNPSIAKMMKVDNMRDLKSGDVQAMSDDDFKKIITEGKGKMKPVPAASGSAADIVAYIRTWKK
jgi:mono/diheme cytochrome c family protein